MYDISNFVDGIEGIIHGLHMDVIGAYPRWKFESVEEERDMGINPYGCADAANTLYTIGRFPQDIEERHSWIHVLQSLQDADSGMFYEATHHEIHTTAHCIAALELFDAKPLYPLTALAAYKNPAGMEKFLDALDWAGNPWGESHRGAGLYAALVLAGEVDQEWQQAYFQWLYNNTDATTGFLRSDCIRESLQQNDVFGHLAGTFHYLFNMEYARQPLAFPAAMIDSCLEIYRSKAFPLGTNIGFAEIDWVFCLTRALRQSGHRHDDVKAALLSLTEDYIPYLLSLDVETHDQLNDLHRLFGMSCCLAELQTALPGVLQTQRPLKNVLDRRPFI
ncbi:MAG: hypothetical protein HRU15_12800 [Planctomycetes bacterium]|nr:hypothetical protein [Planctomycetota bacterium]